MNRFPIFIQVEKNAFYKHFFYSILIILLLVSIYKDVTNITPMPWDLRNRVVGARMMSDGLSPYFYIWKNGDPAKYFDNYVYPSFIVSRSTATPFFHYVFSLVANLPQSQINILWIFVEYCSLLGCAFFAFFSIGKQNRKKAMPAIAAITVALTFTVGWRMHVFLGQNYIFIPLLAIASFYYFRRDGWVSVLMFAIFFSSLILVRPVAILFSVPFLFFLKNNLKWGIATLVAMATYVVFVFCSPVQKKNWQDYFRAMTIYVNHEESLKRKPNEVQVVLPTNGIEGIDLGWNIGEQGISKIMKKNELRGLSCFYETLTGKKLSQKIINVVGIMVSIILLLPLIWFVAKAVYPPKTTLFALGFVVFYIFTFCSPILRTNYCWVEFLFPLLLITIWEEKLFVLPNAFLLLGLYLNIAAPTFIPLRQNIGEFLIIGVLIYHSYRNIFSLLFSKKILALSV